MAKKKKTYVIIILLIIIAGGVYYFMSKKPQVDHTTVKAEKGELKQTVSVTGEIVAPDEIDLSFKIGGEIILLGVSVGDRVENGQKIAELDSDTLELELIKAKAEIKSQEETLRAMQKENDTYNRDQRDAQKHQIEKARAAYDILIKQSEDLILRAPFSGTIIKKNFKEGESVSANSAVVTVAKDGDLEIETYVPESDIIKVAVGQKAKITLNALPSSETLEAQVSEIEPASTVISDVVYYKVVLKLSAQDNRLKVGMSVDADINTADRPDAVMIPLRSIRNEGNREYVEILNDDKLTTRQSNIKTGLRGDDGIVEILSGLSGGEEIVILKEEK